MNRQDVIRCVLGVIDDDTLVVSNIADASFELHMLGDRHRNFYMLGSFGLAPSIALGLALSRDESVVAINGDGALLYNLGTLASEARYAPDNLVHIVVDNGAHGATGYQPTATAGVTDIAAMATGAGLSAVAVHDVSDLRVRLTKALTKDHDRPQLIVAVAPDVPDQSAPPPDLTGHEIRTRFMDALG